MRRGPRWQGFAHCWNGRRQLYYGWYIVGAGASSNFLVAGFVVWSFGVYIEPIQDETGWSRAAIAAGFSIRALEQGLFGPFTGAFIDRFSPRWISRAGFVMLAIGLVLLSQARTLPMYYGASIVLALGQSSGSFAPYTALIVRWFQRKRGRAMGIMNAGNGSGFLLVPFIVFMIGAFGWRESLFVSGILVAVDRAPALVRDAHRSRAAWGCGRMAGRRSATRSARSLDPAGRRRSARSRAATHQRSTCWPSAQAANIATIQGWVVHQFPHLESRGLGVEFATAAGIGYALAQVVFRPASGALGDRIGRRRFLIAAFVLQGIGIVVLAFVSDERIWLLAPYYATFAFGQAAWVVLHSSIVADYFGAKRFATIYALVNAAATPVAIASPVLAGAVFDETGSYIPAFLVYGVLSTSAGFLVLMIRRPMWVERERQREELEAATAPAG